MMEFATGRLTLSMGALAANYTLCQQHNSGAPVAAAVKANAYGHGMVEVANALDDIADGRGVARIEEGIGLRQAGVQQPFIVMSPLLPSDNRDPAWQVYQNYQ